MEHLQKKCLLASAGLHGLLLVLVVTGVAFIAPKSKRQLDESTLKVVPTALIDAALSGGGGNPNIPRSEDRQKGETLAPVPPSLPPPQIVTPPKPQQPTPTPPRVEREKPTPAKPKETAKPATKPQPETKPTTAKTDLLDLKPVDRSDKDKAKAAAEERQRQQAAAARGVLKDIRSARDKLRSGFADGTAVEVSGPGGEAYANYLTWLQAVYYDAWIVSPDIKDDGSTALVRVTIARDGDVIRAEILRRSRNPALDKSIQWTLDRVKHIRPFPEGTRDKLRTFTIEFSLEGKRLIG